MKKRDVSPSSFGCRMIPATPMVKSAYIRSIQTRRRKNIYLIVLLIFFALCCDPLEAKQHHGEQQIPKKQQHIHHEQHQRHRYLSGAKNSESIDHKNEMTLNRNWVGHETLLPLDKYVIDKRRELSTIEQATHSSHKNDAKRFLSIQESEGSTRKRWRIGTRGEKSVSTGIRRSPHDASRSFRKSGESKRTLGNENHIEYPFQAKHKERKPMPLVKVGFESAKGDRESKHGHSIIRNEIKIHNQPLLPQREKKSQEKRDTGRVTKRRDRSPQSAINASVNVSHAPSLPFGVYIDTSHKKYPKNMSMKEHTHPKVIPVSPGRNMNRKGLSGGNERRWRRHLDGKKGEKERRKHSSVGGGGGEGGEEEEKYININGGSWENDVYLDGHPLSSMRGQIVPNGNISSHRDDLSHSDIRHGMSIKQPLQLDSPEKFPIPHGAPEDTYDSPTDLHYHTDLHYPSEYYWDDFNDPFHFGLGGNQLMQMENIPNLPDELHGITSESGCGCWDTESVVPEVECHCGGNNIIQIPHNLSAQVTRITVSHANLDTLRNDSFIRYRNTLQDIVLEDVKEFHSIDAGAFGGLTQLRSIYIHSAPELKFIRNLTFTPDNTKLRSLRIVSSGLERVPNIHFRSHEILHMIELDSNRIQQVHSKSIQVRVEELSLNYNLIQSVDKEAFSGSEIGKLSLKGNPSLTYLHPEAFQGIKELRTLDLSETSIMSLPTSGLKDLEVLRLEHTPTLKVFPSVYSFRTIKKAFLTYPYHCCAFQFPEQHDREQHINHKALEQEHCSEVTSSGSTTLPPITRVRRQPRQTTLPRPARPLPDSHITQKSPMSAKLREPASKEFEKDQRGSATDGEIWGNDIPGSFSDDVIILTNVKEKQYEQNKHKSSKITLKDSKLMRTLDSNKNSGLYRNIDYKSVKNSDGKLHSKTRHYGSRGRRSRPRLNATINEFVYMNHQVSDLKNQGDSLDLRKHQIRPMLGSLRNPLESENNVINSKSKYPPTEINQQLYIHTMNNSEDFIPIPNKRFESENSNDELEYEDGSIPGETFEPIPDKRFGNEEFTGNMGGFSDRFLGFGSFNHSADRYSPDFNRHNDTPLFGSWGDGQNIPGPEQVGPVNPGFNDEFPDDASHEEKDPHDFGIWNPGDGGNWHPTRAPSNNTTLVVMCGNLSKNYHDVMCVPSPDAFNPCEDIMGNLALRVAVWFVVITAVVGNLAVMLVLVSSKFRMTVSKFLMVNLALADLSMGIYLLIIASMDLHTIGVYFNYAIDWQNGPGCKIAGFLTVFASELSIFTLSVITCERWYAITYAIHLNKRLKLSMAIKIMVIGWIYSITMATLPLVGVSGYTKTSICLPMETGDALALAYLISLLLVNGLAFFVITACYASMYCSISRHDASASHSDLTVAKRMALLVFTDFACWAPIAFFGLTAVAGIPLINVTRAKILLVFFYPLNSCANPYLYAILTKQYRRDLFILLARYGFFTKRAMRYKGAYSSVNNTFPHNTVVNTPNHRNSTLTQITLCDLTRTARTSQQSNNGSLLGTMIGGSQDSLQRNVSPSRTPIKPETCCDDTERLSTVQEMSHSNHSDDENNSEQCIQQVEYNQITVSGLVKQSGSPHPIKNCFTKLSFTPEQEQMLKDALIKTKVKRKSKENKENGGGVTKENFSGLTENEKLVSNASECLPRGSGQGEAIVVCEVEVINGNQFSNEGKILYNKGCEEIDEATSTV